MHLGKRLYKKETLAEETGVDMEETNKDFLLEEVVIITSRATKSTCFPCDTLAGYSEKGLGQSSGLKPQKEEEEDYDLLSSFISHCRYNSSIQNCTRDHLFVHHEAQWSHNKSSKQEWPWQITQIIWIRINRRKKTTAGLTFLSFIFARVSHCTCLFVQKSKSVNSITNL